VNNLFVMPICDVVSCNLDSNLHMSHSLDMNNYNMVANLTINIVLG
jgi:hypothetical protein